MLGRFRRAAAALCALAIGFGGTQALAGSAAQPGQTIGLPTGAQLPIGLILLDTSSFGVRNTRPATTENNVNLPAVVWVPGATLFGARLHFIFIQPAVVTSPASGARTMSGVGVPLVAVQMAWKVTPYFSVSYLLGGYLPIETKFVINQGSLQQRVAASYLNDGWNITANLLYGRYFDPTNNFGNYYPDFLNLDLTMVKSFDKWQIGPVAFGSTDLPTTRASYRKQNQFAVGGLIGYNFGDWFLQGYVTRDIVQQNYGGFDTRGWLRGVFFLYKQAEPGGPQTGLLVRR